MRELPTHSYLQDSEGEGLLSDEVNTEMSEISAVSASERVQGLEPIPQRILKGHLGKNNQALSYSENGTKHRPPYNLSFFRGQKMYRIAGNFHISRISW